MSTVLSKSFKEKLHLTLIDSEQRIIKRIEELKKEDPFQDPDHVNDNAAIDTDVREQVGHETIEAQIHVLQKQLEHVRRAIKKIMKDKYGMCESCGKTIDPERLELVPEARYCIACERRLIK